MSNKQLKKTMDDLNLRIFDLIRYIDPSDTGKYMKFLVKEFRKKHNKEGFTNYTPYLVPDNYVDKVRKKCKNELEYRVVEYIMDVLSETNVTNLQVFDELLRSNKIKENDIQGYNSFEEIEMAIVNYEENNHEENIHEYSEIYKDDRWFIVKPLSYYTAKIYGAGTKWCTSSRDTPKQFYSHSNEGILLYIIDKTTNNKWAVHWQFWEGVKEEMSWWDAKDKRIDSIQVEIPFGIMNEVKNHLYKEQKPNIKYFSENSLNSLKKMLDLEKKNTEESRRFGETITEFDNNIFERLTGGVNGVTTTSTTTTGEECNITTGDYTTDVSNNTSTEFDIDEHISKTLEYNYTLKTIDEGGIPQ